MRSQVAIAVLLAATLVAPPSVAATLEVVGVTRDAPPRDSDASRSWISHADCIADDVLHVAVQTSGFAGESSEVWVGGGNSDCSLVASRSKNTPYCWQVFSAGPAGDGVVTFDLRVRDIVGQHRNEGPGAGTISDCVPAVSTTAGVQVLLWFMAVDPATRESKGSATSSVTWDLIGPNPPENVEVRGGAQGISVHWSHATDTDLLSFLVFCEPSSPLDAGGCTFGPMHEGARPDIALLCGGAKATTDTSAWADGLTPGVFYRVGVAGIDRVQNIGPLSNLVCASPKAATPAAGWHSSGCALSPPRCGLPPWLLLAALAALAWGKRRTL